MIQISSNIGVKKVDNWSFSPRSYLANMALLAQQCEELQSRNHELQRRNDTLQIQLKRERTRFADLTNNLGNLGDEIDLLKKATLEMEENVKLLLICRDENTERIRSVDDGVFSHCEQHDNNRVDLKQVLCNERNSVNVNFIQEEMVRASPQLSGTVSPINKLARRVSLLKGRVKGKSAQSNCKEAHGYFRSPSKDSSTSCDSSGVTAPETPVAEETVTAVKHCLVSNMPWKLQGFYSNYSGQIDDSTKSAMTWKGKGFHSTGLYSGQIDIYSKKPDGFGVFKCFCMREDCFLTGDWKNGELIQRQQYSDSAESFDEDGFNQKHPSQFSQHIHDEKHLDNHSTHEPSDSDNVSVTEL